MCQNQVQDIGAAKPRRLNIFDSDGVPASRLNNKGQRKTDKQEKNENKGEGQGNVGDQLFSQMAKQLKDKQESGKPIDVNDLRGTYDQVKAAAAVDPKKKELKEVTKRVLARKMKDGEFPSKKDLVLEMVADIKNKDLRNQIISDLENGFAKPDASAIIDPRAGENEDSVDEDEDGDDRRLGVTFGNNIWPGGVIKITLVAAGSFWSWWPMWIKALTAMVEVESQTTLSFHLVKVIYSKNDMKNDGTSYLQVSDGCYCCVSGGVGAPSSTSNQHIKVSSRCTHGSMMHELLHSAGMMHQQTASYRDRYITVNKNNIESGKESQFDPLDTGHGLEGIYDYGSIMHYGEKAFSKNNGKTIDCHGNRCGQRDKLSNWDIIEIMWYYWGYYFKNPWL